MKIPRWVTSAPSQAPAAAPAKAKVVGGRPAGPAGPNYSPPGRPHDAYKRD